MSTDSPSPENASTTDTGVPFVVHSKTRPTNDSGKEIDQGLIVETRNQIRQLVEEINELSRSNCAKQDFYEGFLNRCTQALASVGGAIWELRDGGLNLEYQINLAQTQLADEQTRKSHDALLGSLLAAGEARLVPPHSGQGQEHSAGNPTEYLLVVVPLIINDSTVGLIEIFQRADSGPATQRGYLRFLNQMGTAANHFLNSHQLRQFDQRQHMWQQLDQFVRNIHETLDVDQSTYAIANEGRRVIECDRVSVAIKQGTGFHVTAVSGLDSIERRADQIKRLNRLTKAALLTQEPLWYAGDDQQLPPQIESLLHDYIDLSHAKIVGILPLRKTKPESIAERDQTRARRNQAPAPLIGALIVEQMGDEQLGDTLVQRSDAVANHGGYALSNAIDHNSILFAGLWRSLGQLSAVTKLRHLPKTLLALGALLATVLAFFLIPASFDLGANGQLVPEKTHEVYALVNGTLMEIYVPENTDEMVRTGQPLARMEDTDLLVEVSDLQGKLQQTIEQIEKFNRAQNTDLDQVELFMMESEMDEALVAKATYEQLIKIKTQELRFLEVCAPANGYVMNWKLRENLIRRPVQKGQNLLTIVDPDTEWLVELELPERRTVHLFKAMDENNEPLEVTFTLASHPGKQFPGRLVDVDKRLDVHSENGNTLKLRVAFEKSQLPEELLREGTRVTAKIKAGTRSLGYVWLHELFETVHSSVLFWF